MLNDDDDDDDDDNGQSDTLLYSKYTIRIRWKMFASNILI